VSAVVGAAVPAAVCRWGLCPCCPAVGRCLSGVYNYHDFSPNHLRARRVSDRSGGANERVGDVSIVAAGCR